jgi:hypothetical protein
VGLLWHATPPVGAAFSATSGNATNRLGADALAAPSGLTLEQFCTVVFRAATTAQGDATATPLSVPNPGQVGDVLVAMLATPQSNPTYTASGWTRLQSPTTVDHQDISMALSHRVVDASTPGSFDFQASAGTLRAVVLAYSGASTSTPASGVTKSAGLSATVTAPSVTTTAAQSKVVAFFLGEDANTLTPSSTTLVSRVPTITDAGLIVRADEKGVAVAGASGEESATVDTAVANIGAQVALVPGTNPTPGVRASWSPTPSTWASGYELQRELGGTVEKTVTVDPQSATQATDFEVTAGNTHTYRLSAYYSSWRSTAVSQTILVDSC